MKKEKGTYRKYLVFILLGAIFFGLMVSSCRRYRYRRMIKKRRTGHYKPKRHKSAYQKKLRKRTVTTNSKYYIKNKRNYRRRPWYD